MVFKCGGSWRRGRHGFTDGRKGKEILLWFRIAVRRWVESSKWCVVCVSAWCLLFVSRVAVDVTRVECIVDVILTCVRNAAGVEVSGIIGVLRVLGVWWKC